MMEIKGKWMEVYWQILSGESGDFSLSSGVIWNASNNDENQLLCQLKMKNQKALVESPVSR